MFTISQLVPACLLAGAFIICGCATVPHRMGTVPKTEAAAKPAGIPAVGNAEIKIEKPVPPVVSSAAVILPAVVAEKKKYLIIIADWGKSGPSEDIINILSVNPKISLTIPWPYAVVPSTRAAELAKNLQIEPVLTLSDEPILPIIYQTKVSSSPLIEFSWPQDVSNIVFKNQEAFKAGFHYLGAGIYLRSGIISKDIMPLLQKLGIAWANGQIPDPNKWGYFEDKFLVVNAQQQDFDDAESLLDWVGAQNSAVVAVVFKDKDQITNDLLSELGKKLLERKDIEMITPQRLLAEYEPLIPLNGAWDTPYDPGPWVKNPAVWHKLSVARNEVEKYKNSGSARINVLDKLRDELYFLYRYDFLSKVQESQDTDDYRIFQAGLNNIYSLMDKKESDVEGGFIQALGVPADTTTFHMEIAENKISFYNAGFTGDAAKLRSFSVELTKDKVIYNVELDPSSASDAVIDIYMDLNNVAGAGIARFLPDADAFMKQQDAWEYAVRIENNRASLYVASRFNASLVRTFGVRDRYTFEVPRSILRGNPLKWGYQAVTLKKNSKSNKYEISDFLCRDSASRTRILENKPVQLNAFRSGNPG